MTRFAILLFWTTIAADDDEVRTRLRRTESLLYDPTTQGLEDFRARFTYQETGFGKPRHVAGTFAWKAPERCRVDVTEGAEHKLDAQLAIEKNFLQFLRPVTTRRQVDAFLKEPLRLAGPNEIEVRPGPKSELAKEYAQFGWKGVRKISLLLDERGLVTRQVVVGEPGEAQDPEAAMGPPTEVELEVEYAPAGERFVIRSLRHRFLRGPDRQPAAWPLFEMRVAIDPVVVKGFTLPGAFRVELTTAHPQKRESPGRRQELRLSEIEANVGIEEGFLSGVKTYEQLRAENDRNPEPLAVGSRAPETEFRDLSGAAVKLKEGEVTVLDFWATWCGPCRRAIPTVQKLHERYRDRGVRVVGVNVWEDPDRGSQDPATVQKKEGGSYPLLSATKEAAEAWHLSAVPTFIVIDRAGKIAFVSTGFDAKLKDQAIEALERCLK